MMLWVMPRGSECANRDQYFSEPHVSFRPDGVFVHKRADGSFPIHGPKEYKGRRVPWKEVLFPVELKKDSLETQSEQPRPILPRQRAMTDDQQQDALGKHQELNAREQLASYALEVLSSNPLKRSTMGMLVFGGRVEVWHFDRLGCLGSESIALNLEAHFQLFVKMVVHIVKSSAETLGFEPSFKYDASWPHSLDICTLPLFVGEDGAPGEPIVTIASDKPLHRSRCLSGRGTSVLLVRLGQSFDPFVMKIGWQASERMSEADFYKMAAGVEGLPDIKCSDTIVQSLREGVRGDLEKALPHDRKLPMDRSLRVLIMTEIYYPLTEAIHSKSLLDDPEMLLNVMKSLLSGELLETDIFYIG